MKVTIPIASAKNGGALYTLVDDLANTNSAVQRTNDGSNLILDDTGVPTELQIPLDQTNLLAVLGESGEVENHLMAIKAPISLANQAVPVGVPYRTNAVSEVKDFKDWFLYGAELWRNQTDGFVLFYTNPLGSQADQTQYLKGSEIELIRQIDTVNIEILTIAEATAEVANPNYVKVDWDNL